jgi:NAD(P)-dependent dehydrogenase (short-subunit alcohol dehydrogenase family)
MIASAQVKNDAILKTALAQIPLKRVVDPSKMARAVLYLASNASSYTTGVSLNVDRSASPDLFRRINERQLQGCRFFAGCVPD